jgi:hypothetical protein
VVLTFQSNSIANISQLRGMCSFLESDTPRKAGGLVSGAASKAVAPAKLIFDNYALRRPMN